MCVLQCSAPLLRTSLVNMRVSQRLEPSCCLSLCRLKWLVVNSGGVNKQVSNWNKRDIVVRGQTKRSLMENLPVLLLGAPATLSPAPWPVRRDEEPQTICPQQKLGRSTDRQPAGTGAHFVWWQTSWPSMQRHRVQGSVVSSSTTITSPWL